MKRLFLVLMSISLLSLQCQKQGVLPTPTQHGANTFGATINGVVFTPYRASVLNPGGLSSGYASTANSNYHLELTASNDNTTATIQIYSNGIDFKVGSKVSLGNFNNITGAVARYFIGIKDYNMIVPQSGELNITYIDTNAKIMSGTFFFDAVDANGNKVAVRDGVFDVTYQ